MNASSGEGVKGSLQTEIAKKQEILNQLPSLKDEGILYAETAELRSYKLRTEISGLEAQIAQLPPENLEAIELVLGAIWNFVHHYNASLVV